MKVINAFQQEAWNDVQFAKFCKYSYICKQQKDKIMETSIERNLLKSVLMELLQENRVLFKELFTEILTEKGILKPENQRHEMSREEKIALLIDEDFKKYEFVFKALA